MIKKFFLPLLLLLSVGLINGYAQCSLCTKTAQQLGHKPALGLNWGILYLAIIPFAFMCWMVLKYRKKIK